VFLDLWETGETCGKHQVRTAHAGERVARPPRVPDAALVGREACAADSPAPTTPARHADSLTGHPVRLQRVGRFCRSHRLEPSMSRKGNCRDNAVADELDPISWTV
jgi:transposase InsO family protein